MHLDDSPRPLQFGVVGKYGAALHGVAERSSGDAFMGTTYVQMRAPHEGLKHGTVLDAQRQRQKIPRTWLSIVRSFCYSLLFAVVAVASLVIFRWCSLEGFREPQAPILSVPLQTSWRLLVTPKVSCSEDPPFVALMMMTGAQDFQGRGIIRNNWEGNGLVAGRRVRLFFVLGTVASKTVQQAVEVEAAHHGDILQHTAPDKYSNLSLKTATIIQWLATSCREAKFLVKADTDTLVNLRVLVPYLKEMENRRDLALGARINHMPTVTNPKARNYQDPLVYPHSIFPPYLSGACYVLSGDLVGKLSHVLHEVHRLRNEDTFLGMCLKRIGVEPKNIGAPATINPWFDPAKGPCAAFRLGAAHAFKRDLLVAMWTWWHSGGAEMCR